MLSLRRETQRFGFGLGKAQSHGHTDMIPGDTARCDSRGTRTTTPSKANTSTRRANTTT
jgi:hypothetical protein